MDLSKVETKELLEELYKIERQGMRKDLIEGNIINLVQISWLNNIPEEKIVKEFGNPAAYIIRGLKKRLENG